MLGRVSPPGDPALLARWNGDEADSLPPSDAARAKALREEAIPLARTAGDLSLLSSLEIALGESYATFEEADGLLQQALQDADRSGNPFARASAQLGLGFNRLRSSRFEEALPYFERALAIAESCNARASVAAANGDLGNVYFRLGDLDTALSYLNVAEKLSGEVGRPDSQRRWLNLIGNVHLALGEFDQALDFYRRSETMARKAHNDSGVAIALSNQSKTAVEKGDLEAAWKHNEDALKIKRGLHDAGSLAFSELNRANIEALRRDDARAEADLKAVIKAAQEAAQWSVVWEAQGALARLYQVSGHARQAGEEYQKAIATVDAQWSKLSDPAKTTFLSPNVIDPFQSYVYFLIDSKQSERALLIAESSRARVLSLRLEEKGVPTRELRVADLQSAVRRTHSVILYYWLSPRRSSVWVLGTGPLQRFDLRSDREIAALARHYAGTIINGGDPLGRHDPTGAELSEAVLGPIRHLIARDADVIVIPDGPLHTLDFGTLVVPDPRPHYWIEDVAIATAPSLRVIDITSRKRAGPPRLLLIGDPVLGGTGFAALPHVKDEISAVLRFFPEGSRAVYTQGDASPQRYAQAEPARFTHIHFATHATANSSTPLDSAIILSPQRGGFRLTAREVARVSQHARLVTISGCDSVGAKAYSGEGFIGFAWAFLQAGAENVIGSLWKLDDGIAAKLMEGLYRGDAAGQCPAQALRAAKCALIREGGSSARPYFWGPLQVYTRRIE